MSIITHFSLVNPGGGYLIAASVKNAPANVVKDMVISSYDGFLDPGELTEEAVARSYSDGYTWNRNATRAGKDFVLSVGFYADQVADVLSDYEDFERFFYSYPEIKITSYGLSRVYNCLPVRLEITSIHNGTAISANAYFSSEEAF